jgi:tetratricopeptide (TPR) repeat protein
MKSLAGRDPQAFLALRDAENELFSTVVTDEPMMAPRLEALIARDPTWLHPYVFLAELEGSITPRAEAAIARAREKGDRARDPVGADLLDSFVNGEAKMTAVAEKLDRDFHDHPDDYMCGWKLLELLYQLRRSADALSVARQLHERRPDLQFGTDMQQNLRYQGRAAEIPKLEAAWLQHAPDNEQALTNAVAVALEEHHPDVAVARARQILTLFGRTVQRLQIMADVFISIGQLDDAVQLTEEMMRGDAWSRAFALYQQGTISLLQGHVMAAETLWSKAAVEAEPFGGQGPRGMALQERASLAEALHERDEERRALVALQKLEDKVGANVDVLMRQVLLAGTEQPRRCLDVRAMAATLGNEEEQASAERQLTRAAQTVGCARCPDVLRLGLSNYEHHTSLLFAFGRCAEEAGDLALARDIFSRAAVQRVYSVNVVEFPSTVYSILSHYHLGLVLAKMGRTAESHTELQRFLAAWEHVDRPIPEVADARRRLDAQ